MNWKLTKEKKVLILLGVLLLSFFIVQVSSALTESFTITQNGVDCETGDCRPLQLGFNRTFLRDYDVHSIYWEGKCWNYNSGVPETGTIVEYYNHSALVGTWTYHYAQNNVIYTDCDILIEFNQGYNLSQNADSMYIDWLGIDNILVFFGHGTNWTALNEPNEMYFYNNTKKMLFAFPPAHGIAAGSYEITYSGTSPSGSFYSLNVTPSNINYGESVNFTINSTLGTYTDITGFTYSAKDMDTNVEFALKDSSNSNAMLDYELIGGVWYQYDTNTHSYSINVGASIPNPLIKIGDAKSGFGVSDYLITCYLSLTDLSLVKITDTLSINNLNNQELVIETKDYLTGDLVSTQLQVQNLDTGLWTNKSSLSGQSSFWYPYNTHLKIYAQSYGYIDALKNWTVTTVPYYRLWVIMYRGSNLTVSDVSLTVSTFDGLNNAPLTNAYVQVSNPFNGALTQNGYTNDAGVITFIIPNDTVWTIRGTKSGYQSATAYLDTTGLGGTATEVSLLLQRSSSVTPIPTATTVPSVTTTLIGGNITPAVCGVLPPHPTIVDIIKNNIACAGITSGANQGYMFAIMIIFVLMLVGSRYAHALGGLVGAGVGFIISIGMGLVPVWVFIALLVIGGIIFAQKIFGSGK